ncbi:hypothetical protein TcWFU_005794 [Taenia crassiceps]|uniref:Uncharacterized protein n=1 Tax=Taenia crassiceps TaxID=6207 RepID=A0ABR4Q7U6_9CEST
MQLRGNSVRSRRPRPPNHVSSSPALLHGGNAQSIIKRKAANTTLAAGRTPSASEEGANLEHPYSATFVPCCATVVLLVHSLQRHKSRGGKGIKH